MMGDWTRGPAGTGEATFARDQYPYYGMEAGLLAESWEVADANTVIVHIRKGVRFHNKPPANGREMNAEDVAFSLNWIWSYPTNYLGQTAKIGVMIESITASDKWTLVIKTVPPKPVHRWEAIRTMLHMQELYPPDAIKQYGDQMDDWRNSSGTGPFMLTDYVRNSSFELVRNPNYWMKDPLHPQNQLPYLDGMRVLVIPDYSTTTAALRTGRIDLLHGGYSPVTVWDQAKSLMQTSPQLKWVEYSGRPNVFYWNIGREPFGDIRVRRALHMATNLVEIRDKYYGGKASLFNVPVASIAEFAWLYTPLEQLPESAQELFRYNPDKAKQLLAEAGYPNGFKTSVLTSEGSVDLLSIVKAYWAKIGVELTLDVKESGAMSGLRRAGDYNTTISDYGATSPLFMGDMLPGHPANPGRLTDQRIVQAHEEVDGTVIPAEIAKAMREFTAYVTDKAYYLQLPAPYGYNFWWPYVKAYGGENLVGYSSGDRGYMRFIWIDQDLRQRMTGRR